MTETLWAQHNRRCDTDWADDVRLRRITGTDLPLGALRTPITVHTDSDGTVHQEPACAHSSDHSSGTEVTTDQAVADIDANRLCGDCWTELLDDTAHRHLRAIAAICALRTVTADYSTLHDPTWADVSVLDALIADVDDAVRATTDTDLADAATDAITAARDTIDAHTPAVTTTHLSERHAAIRLGTGAVLNGVAAHYRDLNQDLPDNAVDDTIAWLDQVRDHGRHRVSRPAEPGTNRPSNNGVHAVLDALLDRLLTRDHGHQLLVATDDVVTVGPNTLRAELGPHLEHAATRGTQIAVIAPTVDIRYITSYVTSSVHIPAEPDDATLLDVVLALLDGRAPTVATVTDALDAARHIHLDHAA